MAHKYDAMEAPQNIDRIISLLKKHDKDTITVEEQLELDTWINSHEDNRKLFAEINDAASRQQALQLIHHFSQTEKLNKILRTKQHQNSTVHFKAMWYRVAASILVVLSVSIGIYWYQRPDDEEQPAQQLTSQYGEDALPGSNRATLTLADGSTIVLSEEQEGIVIQADELLYMDGTSLVQNTVEYATLATPNGGQYQVTLPDGSKVWLNAASSLKYPTTFTGSERLVELTGEAYFEIAPNAKQPFHVKVGNYTVEVLGTHFNVNAYGDSHDLATTLLEGAVRIVGADHTTTKTLKPGEQLLFDGNQAMINQVNPSDFTAWKDGVIILRSYNIQTVIKQLERWYDVEFTGSSALPVTGSLSGELPKDIRLSEFLQALEKHTHVTFTIEGRRVMIKE